MPTNAPPTLAELGLEGDVEKVLDAATKTMTEPTQRWSQQSTLVTNAGKPLPERVRVWRSLSGREAWLPTAQIRHHMKKVHANGKPVFVSSPPEGVFAQPIDQSCDICQLRDVRKVFYSMYDYEGHMESFHPREWTSKKREEDRKERQEEQELMRQLVSGKAKPEASVAVKDRMAKARAAKGKTNGGSSGTNGSADAINSRANAGSALDQLGTDAG